MQVYTDGACSGNNRASHASAAGIGVWFGDGHPLNQSRRLAWPPHTNQRAELAAIMVAVEQLEHLYQQGLQGESTIHSDSRYAIDCLTKWSANWNRNGWKTSTGKPVENQDLIRPTLARLASLPIRFQHVRGHAGDHGNEMADSLAVSGIKQAE